MKTLALSALLVLASAATASAQPAFQLITPEGAVARAKNPDQNFWIVKDKDFQQAYVDHDHSTKPEMHDTYIDYITVTGGAATLVMGDDVKGSKNTAPGEWRADSGNEAKTYPLRPGTLIVIPARMWHRFTVPAGGHIAFIVSKQPDKK